MNTEAKAIARSPAAGMHLPSAGKPVGGDADAGLFACLLTGMGEAATPPGAEPLAEDPRGRATSGNTDEALLSCADGLPPEHAQLLLTQMVGASAAVAACAAPVAQAASAPEASALPGTVEANMAKATAGRQAVSGAPLLNAPTASGAAAGATRSQGTDAVLLSATGAQEPEPESRVPARQTGGRPHGAVGPAFDAHARAEPARGEGLHQVWRAATDVPPARDAALALNGNAPALGVLSARRDREREQERGIERTRTLGGAGELSPTAPLHTVFPVPAAAATVAAHVPDIAQQFHYWINADVQKAELQVDGMGGEAVQVQISLNGNEAQVVFRTDQAQTRELLGHAMDTLDQMLRAQGMALGGGWVGTSGGRGQSSQGQHTPVAQRGAGVSGVAAVRVSPQGLMTAAPLSATGRSAQGVDCFV